MNSKYTGWHTFGLLAILVAVFMVGLLMPTKNILFAWVIILVLLAFFTMLAGHGITGRFWLGWLINEQNRMSLSRLQMFLWTVVILSAFLTAALSNIRLGDFNTALNIAIPEEVWIAMGISTVSLVGTPLILGKKREQNTNREAAGKTLVLLGSIKSGELKKANDPANIASGETKEINNTIDAHADGQLFVNEKQADAQLVDLFMGEEVGNAATLDLTRLQNLFFTFILVGSYAASLGNLIAMTSTSTPISEFPEIGASSIALLAISHAGFLVGKAVDKQAKG